MIKIMTAARIKDNSLKMKLIKTIRSHLWGYLHFNMKPYFKYIKRNDSGSFGGAHQ
jgi:hypothetical protein